MVAFADDCQRVTHGIGYRINAIRSVVQAVADAVLAVCKERKLTDAKLYTSHWA